jgi:hypothetical protein
MDNTVDDQAFAPFNFLFNFKLKRKAAFPIGFAALFSLSSAELRELLTQTQSLDDSTIAVDVA